MFFIHVQLFVLFSWCFYWSSKLELLHQDSIECLWEVRHVWNFKSPTSLLLFLPPLSICFPFFLFLSSLSLSPLPPPLSLPPSPSLSHYFRFLLSGSSCKNALIWDTQNSQAPPTLLVGHTREVTAVAWCPTQLNKVTDSNSMSCDYHVTRLWRVRTVVTWGSGEQENWAREEGKRWWDMPRGAVPNKVILKVSSCSCIPGE